MGRDSAVGAKRHVRNDVLTVQAQHRFGADGVRLLVQLGRQDSGQDVFVHHTSIVGAGFKTLNEGEEVNFEVVTSDKGPKAQNVQRVA